MNDSQGTSSTPLSTASDVVDAVGGTLAAAKLTGSKMPAVSGWRATGRLPPRTFLKFSAELAARGFTAPSTLWGIEPASAAGAT